MGIGAVSRRLVPWCAGLDADRLLWDISANRPILAEFGHSSFGAIFPLLDLTQIGHDYSGVKTQPYFSRAFKRHTGMAPKQFRQQSASMVQ